MNERLRSRFPGRDAKADGAIVRACALLQCKRAVRWSRFDSMTASAASERLATPTISLKKSILYGQLLTPTKPRWQVGISQFSSFDELLSYG